MNQTKNRSPKYLALLSNFLAIVVKRIIFHAEPNIKSNLN